MHHKVFLGGNVSMIAHKYSKKEDEREHDNDNNNNNMKRHIRDYE